MGALIAVVVIVALLLGLITVNTLTAFIPLVLTGVIVGVIARLIVPGRQLMGIGMTILYGIAGAFLGAFLAANLLHVQGLGAFVVQVLLAAALVAAFAPRVTYTPVHRW